MARHLQSGIASTALIIGLGILSSGARAESIETLQSVDALKQENAALQKRLQRLELEQQNAALRARVRQLEAKRLHPAEGEIAGAAAEPVAAKRAGAAAATADVFGAYAADMSVKAAPLLPRYYSWTGFYVGGNIGYGVGSDRASGTVSEPAGTLSGGDAVIAPVGAIGGVQLGYNWQGGPNWLVGFEADFQGSAQKGISCHVECAIISPQGQTVLFTDRHKLDYFGTVRGRVGFVNNDTLFYVTGGGAYGRIEQTLTSTLAFPPAAATFGTASTRENKFGFVVGGGIEAALGGNWTGKVEYLYMDLGSISTSLSGTDPGAKAPFTFPAAGNIRDNIVRAGLNYRMGGESQPVSAYSSMAAVPGVPYSWTGFYVGANVGYGFGNDHVAQTETVTGINALFATSEPGTALTPKGVVGGVQLGYNWQGGRNWLVGFEADLQATNQNDTGCGPLICFNETFAAGGGGTNFITVQHQLDYFGTIRGRLGAVTNNNIVYYATGGVALGHVKQTVDVNSTLSNILRNGSSTADMIGWVAGGGIEAPLWGGWTGKAEYLYMDLGSISTTLDISVPGAPTTLATTSTIRDHIVRAGVNYHFDSAQPVVAKY